MPCMEQLPFLAARPPASACVEARRRIEKPAVAYFLQSPNEYATDAAADRQHVCVGRFARLPHRFEGSGGADGARTRGLRRDRPAL